MSYRNLMNSSNESDVDSRMKKNKTFFAFTPSDQNLNLHEQVIVLFDRKNDPCLNK